MPIVDYIALSLAGLLVATMPLFAAVRRRQRVGAHGPSGLGTAPTLDADVARRPTTIILGYWVRDWFIWVIGPFERMALRAGLTPDVFNYLGALFGLAAGVAYALGSLALAGWLIIFGGVADIFDGRIARARGVASPYGAFIDSTLDRFSETFAFVGVIAYFALRPLALVATALALGGSLLVSYARARGEGLGINHKGGVMQRAERLVVLAVASILDGMVTSSAGWAPGTLLFVAVALIAAGAFGTAIYRTAAISSELARRDR